MLPDYAKYPQIPPNCRLNYNGKSDLYQVYREQRTRDRLLKAAKSSIRAVFSIYSF